MKGKARGTRDRCMGRGKGRYAERRSKWLYQGTSEKVDVTSLKQAVISYSDLCVPVLGHIHSIGEEIYADCRTWKTSLGPTQPMVNQRPEVIGHDPRSRQHDLCSCFIETHSVINCSKLPNKPYGKKACSKPCCGWLWRTYQVICFALWPVLPQVADPKRVFCPYYTN